jgi:hypothetical protein
MFLLSFQGKKKNAKDLRNKVTWLRSNEYKKVHKKEKKLKKISSTASCHDRRIILEQILQHTLCHDGIHRPIMTITEASCHDGTYRVMMTHKI